MALNLREARREVLSTLGLLAAAREPLTADLLADLFTKETERIEAVLALAAGWLKPRSPGHGSDEPFVFAHASFAEFALGQIARAAREQIHRRIAAGCSRYLQHKGHPARMYGLRHLPHHLAASGQQDELVDLLLDFDYLQSKLSEVSVNSILTDYRLTGEALKGHARFKELDALERMFGRNGAFLTVNPDLLVP
jgi:hypothetical protein